MPRTQQRRLPIAEALFHSGADGLALIDRNRTIVAANLALEKMTGWSLKEIIGKSCLSLFQCQDGEGALICEHPEKCGGLKALNSCALTPCRALTITTREGKSLCVSTSYAPVVLEGSQPTYAIAIYKERAEPKMVSEPPRQPVETDDEWLMFIL